MEDLKTASCFYNSDNVSFPWLKGTWTQYIHSSLKEQSGENIFNIEKSFIGKEKNFRYLDIFIYDEI